MDGNKSPLSQTENNIDNLPKDLFRLWRIPFSDETEQPKVENALRERIKELNCLYGVSQLAERYFNSLDNLLKELVNFLPLSWQYPDITCARIVFQNNEYKTPNFKKSKYKVLANIMVFGKKQGILEIYYLKKKAQEDEGLFLIEETNLINEIAERLGRFYERRSAQQKIKESEEKIS